MGLPVGPVVFDLSQTDEGGNFFAGIVRPVPAALVEDLEPTKIVFYAPEDTGDPVIDAGVAPPTK